MFCCGKIYSFRVRRWICNLYDKIIYSCLPGEEMLGGSQSYMYDSLSLEELVIMAKKDTEATGDVLNRLINTIYQLSKATVRINPTLEFNVIYYALVDALHNAIKAFDPSKGEFLHFYRKMCSVICTRCSARAYTNLHREVSLLGHRVMDVDFDNVSAFNEYSNQETYYRNRAIRLDLKDFVETLPERKKRIFLLYLKNVPVGKIAEMENQPYTTIYSIIMSLIKKFNER